MHTRHLAVATALGVTVSTGLGVASPATAQATPTRPLGHAIAAGTGDHRVSSGVSANLFMWNWPSVANECTKVLGPAGYASVQVAPPADSMKRTALGNGSDTVLHPWWEVYQPADYTLTSRMGTPAQFASMVRTCRKAGVKVIVDTVINHMTGQGAVSYGGTSFTKYAYKGLYSSADFHSYPKDCSVAPAAGTGSQEGSITDWNDYSQVFNCELVGLSDLRTQSTKVRTTLAGYMNHLLDLGVSGFRIDAAKHIGQTDLTAIESRLHRTVDGTRPFVALEVSSGGVGRLAPASFTGQGDVLGFDFASAIQAAFQSYNNPTNAGNIGTLKGLSSSGLVGSGKELVFVENHDTERNGQTLNYKAPNNVLANEFMLAYGYGTPQVYSGFAWKTSDDSPPSDASGHVTNTVCNGTTWVCVDRDKAILGMVGFFNQTRGTTVQRWYDDGTNLVGFSRGRVGYFAANNEARTRKVTVSTGLAAGTYCDRTTGRRTGAHTCSGATVVVDRYGRATLTIAPYAAVAFTRADRIR